MIVGWHSYAIFCFRQRRLEEGLLLSGQIKDAIDGLLDWLARTEPLLVDDCPVCGDIDTVTTLMENHKVCQQLLLTPPCYWQCYDLYVSTQLCVSDICVFWMCGIWLFCVCYVFHVFFY